VFCPFAPLRRELDQVAPLRRYPRKKVLFLEGYPVTDLIIVCAGRLRLFRDTLEGKEIILRWAGPGDLIGYVGLFAQVPFDLSGLVEDEGWLRRLSLAQLRRLAHQDAGLYERLLAYICWAHHELRQDYGLLLSKGSPRVRLARLLLNLSSSANGSPDGHLHLSVEKLARKLGRSRQMVSELLAELRRDGMIIGRGAKINIRDSEALKKLAELDE